MPNDIVQVFDNDQFGQIRVVTTDGESWFVAKDVCDALGLSNVSVALHRLDDDERSKFNLGRQGETNVINEAGLYSLVMASKKPEAKAFKRWVTHEVLPSIRKRGGYMVAKPDETPEQVMARALLIAQETLERQGKELEEIRPKALFADAVSTSSSTILVRDLAKLLRQNGFKVGERRLYAILREQGYICKTDRGNRPTQRAMEMGLFEIKETCITHSDGTVTTRLTPRVTGKGQVYFVNRFCPS